MKAIERYQDKTVRPISQPGLVLVLVGFMLHYRPKHDRTQAKSFTHLVKKDEEMPSAYTYYELVHMTPVYETMEVNPYVGTTDET
jgi:hypothetical protein